MVLANPGALEVSGNRAVLVELGDPAVQAAVADRARGLRLGRAAVAGPTVSVITACRPVETMARVAAASAAAAEITRARAAAAVATAWVEEDIAAAVVAGAVAVAAAAVVAGADK